MPMILLESEAEVTARAPMRFAAILLIASYTGTSSAILKSMFKKQLCEK